MTWIRNEKTKRTFECIANECCCAELYSLPVGMLHSGVGETHINNFLSTLDIPPVCHKTLKKAERAVRVVIESCAKRSCMENLLAEGKVEVQEKQLTVQPSCEQKPSQTPPICNLSAEKLSLFQRRLSEGYDCDIDKEYLQWKSQVDATCSRRVPSSSAMSIASSGVQTASASTASSGEVTAAVGTVCATSKHEQAAAPVTVSYDMRWAKRGRAMNSLTGAGAAVGRETGKVVAYGTRNKRCITCSIAERENRFPKPHDCRRNHYGSSKSMEPAVAVQKAQESMGAGVRFDCLAGDDDSSTIKHLREEFGDVEKHSDIGHAKRSLGSKLFEARSDKSCKQLTKTVISYMQKMFSYALQSNAGNADALRETFLAIVPHAYGEDDSCSNTWYSNTWYSNTWYSNTWYSNTWYSNTWYSNTWYSNTWYSNTWYSNTWCGYLKNPADYRHNGLPHGKDPSCSATCTVLYKLFSDLAEQSSKLAPLGSSQVNEALNNTISSKAPKARHYGGSESQDFRTAAAVLQKNIGHAYVSTVTSEAMMSPSKHADQRNSSIDAKEATRKSKASTKVAKTRRRILRNQRSSQQQSTELREGVTYQSSCSFVPDDLDTTAIPAPLATPDLEKLMPSSSRSIVWFDLETTSLQRSCQIIQIAASVDDGHDVENLQFNQYLLPTESISAKATEVTGLTVSRVGGQRRLVKHGKPLEALDQGCGLSSFLNWLEDLGKSVVLVGHNCHSFDMRVFLNSVMREGLLSDFSDFVDGFGDSLPALKSVLPGQASYSLPVLHKEVLGEQFQAHDALADVEALVRLVHHTKASVTDHVVATASVAKALKHESGKQ